MTAPNNLLSGATMTDELINLLRELRPNYSDIGSRDVDTTRRQKQIDRAIELLSASEPAAPLSDADLLVLWAKADYLPQGEWLKQMHAVLTATPAAPSEEAAAPFQSRVQPWLMECFGPMIAGDREERNHRFFEEATELVQACGMTASEAHQLVDYVYGRPVGEPAQEVGGVMVTLAALCLANDLDMHAAAETELARIWTKVEAIRTKQAAKPKHSPLPAAPAQSGEPVASYCPSRFGKQPHAFNHQKCGYCGIAAAQPAQTPQVASQDDERAAFEAWARNEFDIDAGTPLFREGKGYMGLAINAAWRAWRGSWQALAASPQSTATQQAQMRALTDADVERQYREGIHIGSGLPRATCPCGFCIKHRFGLNSGDAAQPESGGE
jgi:hypothetical protein